MEYINRRLDPSAWIKKYLIVDSDSWLEDEVIIRGINLIMLISRANHANNQLDLVMAIIELRIIDKSIRDVNGNEDIKAWRSWTP